MIWPWPTVLPLGGVADLLIVYGVIATETLAVAELFVTAGARRFLMALRTEVGAMERILFAVGLELTLVAKA